MKKLITLIVFFVLANGNAQIAPPEMISYRAIAFNGSTLLANVQIGVRVSILKTSGAGTAVYEQTFSYKTDAIGHYSFFIGSTDTDGSSGPIISTTISSIGSIGSIKWGDDVYFLQVEIDPDDSGPNPYTIVGNTQLVSVPYALHAKNAEQLTANGGFEIAINRDDLINNIKPEPNKLVYVKGYYEEGDGGGGFFLFKHGSTFPENLGTIFQSADTLSGKWLRQYSGYMDVRYFGVRRDWDDTSPYTNSKRIQNMIDYAASYVDINATYHNTQHDLTIFFPQGNYFIDSTLVLKDRVHLLGTPGTYLVNKEANNKYEYMFDIDKGPVSHLQVENFFINCNGRKGCGGFRFKPQHSDTDSTGLGGLWDSSFRNINILSATLPAINLEGPEYKYDEKETRYVQDPALWNQMLIFDNIRASRWDNPDEPSLKITGYCANVTFINSQFANSEDYKVGDKYLDGACIYIGSLNDGEEPKQGSYAISFLNCGFGIYSRYGAVIENSSSITFDTGFYEGTDIAFVIRDSKQIRIVNNRFANASGMGVYTTDEGNLEDRTHLAYGEGDFGSIVTAENSIVSVVNNNVDVSGMPTKVDQQYFITGIGNNNVFDVNTNSFMYHELAKTLVMYHVIGGGITSGTIDTSNQKVVFLTVPGTYASGTNDLRIIKSDLSTGEYLVLRANEGPVKIIPMSSGTDNLFLPGGTPITINNGHTATFVRIENTFQLISVQ